MDMNDFTKALRAVHKAIESHATTPQDKARIIGTVMQQYAEEERAERMGGTSAAVSEAEAAYDPEEELPV